MSRATYAVDIARSSLPLRVSVATVRNPGEGVCHIRVDAGVFPEVKLVPVPMRVGTTRMARLSAAGDDETTSAGAL